MPYHTGHNMVDVHALFDRAQVFEGMHAADLGCGRTGHIVFPLAQAIGEGGVVYAVDIMKDILENTRKRAALSAFHNVHTVWANLEQVGCTAIPDSSLDAGFLVNTLSQATDRHAVLDEAHRLLKEKARLIVVDWKRKGLPFGPADAHFVDFEDVEEWTTQHGFVLQERFDVGPYHHGIVLYRT
jgi:ubiquinone/menaquinone biosynthesis C-methylase UbiE